MDGFSGISKIIYLITARRTIKSLAYGFWCICILRGENRLEGLIMRLEYGGVKVAIK